MQRFTLKGFAHSVRIDGPATSTRPVLLLHGFPDSHKLFDKQVSQLRGVASERDARGSTRLGVWSRFRLRQAVPFVLGRSLWISAQPCRWSHCGMSHAHQGPWFRA